MKITAVNTYFVRPRWGFVEIVTDNGYTGWGEAVLEGHASAVLACVQEYKDYLAEKFGLSRTKLRSKSAILAAAEENAKWRCNSYQRMAKLEY